MKLPKELQKKIKKTSKKLKEKGIDIDSNELGKVVNAVAEAKITSFHCHIKGKMVVFMDCFTCFDSPNEDGKCYIFDNELKKRGELNNNKRN